MEETNSAPTVTTRSVGMRYGLIMAGCSIALFLILDLIGVDQSQGIGRWIGIPITLVILYLAHKNFIDNGDGYMSYGQGVGISFWTGLISSVLYGIFFYVYIKFINSAFLDNIKRMQEDQMRERGMSEEQLEQAMSMASAFMTPEVMFIFAMVFGVIGAVICGLIVSIVTQKRNPEVVV